MLTNPLDLFAEFELLNFPGVLDTGGQWTIESAPAFPFDMCTDCGGGYTDVPYTAAGQDVCTGIHDPVLDMMGALGACVSGQIADGQYIFKYAVLGGSCPSESLFTVNVVDGVITVDIVRVPDVCMIEMFTENPDTPGSKEADLAIINQALNPKLDLRYKVVRRNLDGCSAAITDLYNVVEVFPYYYQDDLGKTPGSANPLTHPVDGVMDGLFIATQNRMEMAGWTVGGYINKLRFGRNSGIPAIIDIDCSAVDLAGVSAFFKSQYATALRAEIGAQLISVYGATSAEVAFDVVYATSTDELLIWTTCCNNPSTQWYGIDKNNWEIEYYPDGVNIEVDNNHASNFTYLDDKIIDQLYLYKEYLVEDCTYYGTLSDCGLSVWPYMCTVDYSQIFDFANCNFNEITLITGTKADIIDGIYLSCAV